MARLNAELVRIFACLAKLLEVLQGGVGLVLGDRELDGARAAEVDQLVETRGEAGMDGVDGRIQA